MAYISVTNTFTTATTISAANFNTNFSDITNGLSDGSKDVYVGKLSAATSIYCAGTLAAVGVVSFSTSVNANGVVSAASGMNVAGVIAGSTSITATGYLSGSYLKVAKSVSTPATAASHGFLYIYASGSTRDLRVMFENGEVKTLTFTTGV